MNIDQLANNYKHKQEVGGATTPVLKSIVKKAKPYIKKIIHKLDVPSGIEYSQQDLEQEANLMVVKALRNYDRASEAKFSTYMHLRVHGKLIGYMRKHDKLTRTQRNRAGKVRKAVHSLSQELGREPSCKEIADEIGHSTKEVRRFIRQMNSRNKSNYEDEKDTLESLEGTLEKSTEMSDELKEKMRSLDVRSRVILILVFYHDLTTKQIGKIVDIHQHYVSTLKQRALKSLRE